jgi:predicted N-acetyltransferase YhbS
MKRASSPSSRRAGDVLLQVLAEKDGRVVGHILFYPMGVRGKLGGAGLGTDVG